MLQFFDLCRLCAQKKRNKMDLFTGDEEETNILITKIAFCLSVQVTREDLLPKMICVDCQRNVEQFNMFRMKCHKAEERLNKMLSLNLPNKLMVTRIKQECLETDFHDNVNVPIRIDSPKKTEQIPCLNFKSVKNVKSELDETDNETQCIPRNYNASPDLIQIISEEIVNQHQFEDDIKHPQIEIVSEHFIDEFKERDFNENVTANFCDIKTVHLNPAYVGDEINNEINAECGAPCVENEEVDPTSFIEVKMQITDNETEQQFSKCTIAVEKQASTECLESIKTKTRKKFIVDSDTEVDEKYLTLGENETCDVNIEEMEAIIKKKSDPNTRFNCSKCKKSFKLLKCYKKHKETHTSDLGSYICDLCVGIKNKSFQFSSLQCLKSHIQRKHLSNAEGKFSCQLCNRNLQTRGQLNSHMKKVHDNSGATCQTCGKGFKNKTRLADHLKVHQEDRPYVCDQCGQSFKWTNALKVHIQSHKQEKNFLCSECGKKFAAKKNLVEHLNIHTGKRPHVCKHCNASFIQLSAYSKHLYVHNEELKIHKCDKCGKGFSHSYMLKQHMLQHSGLRPFQCSECHNCFKSQSDLCSHIKIHQEKQYSCNVCERKFSRSKTLKDHMVRHTGIKHICPAPGCGKSYTQRFPLTKHFCKNHPHLVIVNRMGGKKAHLAHGEICSDQDFIRYSFRYKDEVN